MNEFLCRVAKQRYKQFVNAIRVLAIEYRRAYAILTGVVAGILISLRSFKLLLKSLNSNFVLIYYIFVGTSNYTRCVFYGNEKKHRE